MANAGAEPLKCPVIPDDVTSSTWKFATWIADAPKRTPDCSLLQTVHRGNCIREQQTSEQTRPAKPSEMSREPTTGAAASDSTTNGRRCGPLHGDVARANRG